MRGTAAATEMEDDMSVQQQLYLNYCIQNTYNSIFLKERLPLLCLQKVQHLTVSN